VGCLRLLTTRCCLVCVHTNKVAIFLVKKIETCGGGKPLSYEQTKCFLCAKARGTADAMILALRLSLGKD
jgi:hypothetical protein